jgi:proton-translocating NADH-quinone oxidoreductase chain N
MLSLFVLVPIALAITINILPKRWMGGVVFWTLAALCVAQALLVVLPIAGFWYAKDVVAAFFGFSFAFDSLSLVMLLSISLVILSALVTEANVKEDYGQRYYYKSLLLTALAGMNGIVLTRDIFTLYVFMEIVAISSFILICFTKNRDALEGAFKYVVFSAVASVMMLSSIGLTLVLAGGTQFETIRLALMTHSSPLLILISGLFLTGLFIKGGLMPFHGWLPDTYSGAPSSVAVLLAGVVTKAAGVYPLMRLFYSVYPFSASLKEVVMFVGAVSIVLGALAALPQTNFKRMLAYSSISQVGYIILSFGCATPLAMAGALFHLFNHSIFKSILFVNSGTLRKQLKTVDMEAMGGLASRMPVTGVTSALACLSVAGIPPLSGFWSKLIIIMALFSAGKWAYAFVAVLASVITLGYMLTLQRKVFFGKVASGLEGVVEGSPGLLVPALFLTAIMVIVGIFFPFMINSFLVPLGGI